MKGTGGAKGERLDIRVDAVTSPPGEQSRISAVIEVMACWNPGVMSDMEEQLVGRYLAEYKCRHGLYVVGSYLCPQWDEDDYRKPNSGRRSVADLKETLKQQAEELSSDRRIVRSFVLNTSLP